MGIFDRPALLSIARLEDSDNDYEGSEDEGLDLITTEELLKKLLHPVHIFSHQLTEEQSLLSQCPENRSHRRWFSDPCAGSGVRVGNLVSGAIIENIEINSVRLRKRKFRRSQDRSSKDRWLKNNRRVIRQKVKWANAAQGKTFIFDGRVRLIGLCSGVFEFQFR